MVKTKKREEKKKKAGLYSVVGIDSSCTCCLSQFVEISKLGVNTDLESGSQKQFLSLTKWQTISKRWQFLQDVMKGYSRKINKKG